MRLTPGARIGSYEIVSALGAGGMGVVYRAHDTKLGRDVAIKVLPDTFASDPERLARFQREARMLASLNHPNIAQIHDSGGGLADTAAFLVMELVEGDDLSAVIARGALQPRDALAIARQIALALEGAHDAGVIHRDLKPANIKVKPDGTVKVLDFGLAKIASAESSHSGGGSTATSPAMTGIGVILGTAYYMSPEQARGRAVDRRSDLWAFGVVLFEMMSGRKIFAGDTVTDVIAAVVTQAPDWTALPPETPVPIRRLLRRCLEKDPNRRLRDAADARLEIEETEREHDDGADARTGAAPARRSTSRRRWALGAGWAATIIAAAAIGATALREHRADVPLRVLNLTVPAGTAPTFALSPDGQWVSVVSDKGILVKGMHESAWRELSGTAGAGPPMVWSPDSRSIAFPMGSSIRKVDVVGSRPQTICDRCVQFNSLRGGSWNRDGVLLLGGSPEDARLAGGLFKISVNGGAMERVTTLDAARGDNSHRFPAFLPDGRRFVFTVRRDNGEHEIRVGDLDGHPPWTVTSGFSKALYVDGYLLFARDETLLALAFDAASGTPSGDPLKVARPVLTVVGTGHVSFAVSDEGTLVFGAPVEAYGYILLDRHGRTLADVTRRGADPGARLTRDGRRAVIAEVDPEKSSTDIYVIDVATGARSRLTSDPGWEQNPVWSPEGERVAYRLGREIYVQAVAGGRATKVGDIGTVGVLHDWSADGRSLLLTRQATAGGELTRLSLADGRMEAIAPSAASEAGGARLSPDGRWVAYLSGETGSTEVHVRSFPDGRVTRRVTTAGGDAPLWSRDSTELFYRDGDGWVVASRIRTTGSAIDIGASERLFKPIVFIPLGSGYQIDVDAAGRFLEHRIGDEIGAFASTLTVMLNWTKAIVR